MSDEPEEPAAGRPTNRPAGHPLLKKFVSADSYVLILLLVIVTLSAGRFVPDRPGPLGGDGSPNRHRLVDPAHRARCG
jgi:hypothetical protein